MEKDVLIILMLAFGFFAIAMFILFYIYAKKYYNEKHLSDDYHSDDNVEKVSLIDIRVNDKTIVFDANNYHLRENEKVRVMMDNEVMDGIVIHANYEEILANIKETPRLLVLAPKEELEEERHEEKYEFKEEIDNNEVNNIQEPEMDYDEMEFVPTKKQ